MEGINGRSATQGFQHLREVPELYKIFCGGTVRHWVSWAQALQAE
jgi:hypothetical protein